MKFHFRICFSLKWSFAPIIQDIYPLKTYNLFVFVVFCFLFTFPNLFVFLQMHAFFFYFGIQLHTMYSMAWYGQANPFTMHVKCSNCTYWPKIAENCVDEMKRNEIRDRAEKKLFETQKNWHRYGHRQRHTFTHTHTIQIVQREKKNGLSI